jgi:DHA2 family multidrug resistance protein
MNAGYWEFFWPLIIQGSAMGLLFIPLTTITNDPIPKEEIGNATSLFNLMRNMGASIGIASVTTLYTRHQQFHINVLGANVNSFSLAAHQVLQEAAASLISRGADAHTASNQAYAVVFGMVERQATIMSFNDVFWLLTLLFLLMLPLVFLMRKPSHQGGAPGVH